LMKPIITGVKIVEKLYHVTLFLVTYIEINQEIHRI
jgi:hypothetical protein